MFGPRFGFIRQRDGTKEVLSALGTAVLRTVAWMRGILKPRLVVLRHREMGLQRGVWKKREVFSGAFPAWEKWRLQLVHSRNASAGGISVS